MISRYGAHVFSKWFWNGSSRSNYYRYHPSFYIPHTLYFYCKVLISQLLFESHSCLLGLQHLITYMFLFHNHVLQLLLLLLLLLCALVLYIRNYKPPGTLPSTCLVSRQHVSTWLHTIRGSQALSSELVVASLWFLTMAIYAETCWTDMLDRQHINGMPRTHPISLWSWVTEQKLERQNQW
jgi:hypothetical protein